MITVIEISKNYYDLNIVSYLVTNDGKNTQVMTATLLKTISRERTMITPASLVQLVLFGHDVSRCLLNWRNSRRLFSRWWPGFWWAAGVGVFATTLSSITFMSNSCQSVYFRLDVYHWSVSGYRNFTAGFYFYIPFFGSESSAYEYLEARFVCCRLFASMSFMLFHIGRIAIITFLTVLALRQLNRL